MSPQRTFRFGVVAGQAQSFDEWREKVRKAESLGYDVLLAPDTFSSQRLAPFPALTAAALLTSLHVGSYVCCTDYRHPVVLAKESVTVNRLTNGRFLLGIGPGNWVNDYEQAGIPFDAAGVRVSRFEEALTIIQRLWTEEKVSFTGTYFTINEMQGFKDPLLPPPAIYIGAGGQRMLKIAGRTADIIGIASLTQSNRGYGPSRGVQDFSSTGDEGTRQKIAWIQEAAGDRFNAIELACPIFRIEQTTERERAFEQIGKENGIAPELVSESLSFLVGSVEQMTETLLARRERYGISYLIVFEYLRDAFAPIIARLKESDRANG